MFDLHQTVYVDLEFLLFLSGVFYFSMESITFFMVNDEHLALQDDVKIFRSITLVENSLTLVEFLTTHQP